MINFLRYEVAIFLYSVLFAEALPAKWEERGAARRVFNEAWKWGAMFIVLIYLCNLRSHLIKKIPVKPPDSIEELVSSNYDYKILIFPGFDNHPTLRGMENKKRLVMQKKGTIRIEKPLDHTVSKVYMFTVNDKSL